LPHRRFVSEGQRGQALHQHAESDFGFQLRQCRTQADVRPLAEGQVHAFVTPDIETLRITEAARIVIGLPDMQDGQLAALQALAGQRHVLQQAAAGVLHRAVMAQHLPHGHPQGGRVRLAGLECGPLRGILQQGEHAIAEQIAGGLVAGKEQGAALGQQFVAIQLSACMGLQQAAQKTSLGQLVRSRQRLAEEITQIAHGLLRREGLRDVRRRTADEGRQIGRPVDEFRRNAVGQSQQLRNHQGGQGTCKARDEIEAACCLRIGHDGIGQPLRQCGDVATPGLQVSRFESRIEYAAQAAMGAAVEEQQGTREQALELTLRFVLLPVTAFT